MKREKVFISHSSKDISIVEAFVENILQLGLGIPGERIFCTSMEGHGVKSGEYIPDRLRKEVRNTSVAFLFISKNYKSSEVCLNEVGAAWVFLEKENIIPVLLPDVDFNELGFLDLGRLGIKVYEKEGLLRLVQDNKEFLNQNFDLGKLNKQIELFLKKIQPFILSNDFDKSQEVPREIDEWKDCFEDNLIPFNNIIRQAIPAHDEGIHEIKDERIQNRILTKLSEAGFLDTLWYKKAKGDFYVQKLRKNPSGNWLISTLNWEVKVSSLWVSMDMEHQNDFILIHSEAQPPFKIDTDIGGESYCVGILNDGTVVSENERSNGFAVIGGETIELDKYGCEPRIRDRQSHWVFFVSYYHKLGYNPDETIEFCKNLDLGQIEVNEENLFRFLMSLRNHPIVRKWR